MADRNQVQLDSKGFDDMLRTLQKKTGASYRDVVRGTTGDVLTGAARRTREGDDKSMNRAINRAMRRPYTTRSGEKIGVMKNKNVWYQGAGWPNNRWVLVRQDGRLVISDTVKRSAKQGFQKVSAGLKARISRAISEAQNYKINERQYLKSVRGLSKASWLHMMRKLRLKIPGGAKLKNALRVKVPARVQSAALARENGRGDEFFISISNRVQATLNNKARGTGAFRQSLNGLTRRFQKKTGEDLEKYAKRFAKKNGFTIR